MRFRATMILVLIALSVVPSASAAETNPSKAQVRHEAKKLQTPRLASCKPALRGIVYFHARYGHWVALRGHESVQPASRPAGCAHARWRASVWKERAATARKSYERWAYEYDWASWLPDKFRRVGHCETGGTSGATAAGNWAWDSGRFVSAFGIYRPAYEAYHTWTGRNTPREQYEVAAAIQARYSWGAWGCGAS
jgi:hypothetical protein